jgi:hypothetical protein
LPFASTSDAAGFLIDGSITNVATGDHDDEHDGADRPADLQARVAVDLGGHAALAARGT